MKSWFFSILHYGETHLRITTEIEHCIIGCCNFQLQQPVYDFLKDENNYYNNYFIDENSELEKNNNDYVDFKYFGYDEITSTHIYEINFNFSHDNENENEKDVCSTNVKYKTNWIKFF